MESEIARTQANHIITDYEILRDKVDTLGIHEGIESQAYLQAVSDLLSARQQLIKYIALGWAKEVELG